MVSKYSTKIDLQKRKTSLKDHSRFAKRNSRNYMLGGLTKNPFKKMSAEKRKKIKKIAGIVFAVIFVIMLGVFLRFMWYLQTITKDLPSPDAPFGIRDESSIILASQDGSEDYEELYKLFGEENLDFITIDQVPEHVKWAVLAAEDIDFYEHPGFDVAALTRAGMNYVFGVGEESGGSTITQQLIKQTSIGDERTLERKVKEIILSLQVERIYDKDRILEMYLNVNNFGSNIYGIKTASKFYFGKDNLEDLTLAEAAVLARIPQTPLYNSPTLAPDPEEGKKRAKAGQEYVLDQMKENLDKINDHIESDDNIILEEEIEAAKSEEMVYKEPRIDIKAPHFVFYVRQVLTSGPYNNGEPFDLAELETGGYKIYTTLNTTVQKIAEEEVKNGVTTYAQPYGGNNGSVIITKPDTGDILAMVGSKDYFAPSEGKLFDGKVNVTNTLQSMGSSMKPINYEKAFELGISSPGSYLPDVPIEINGYRPKNWNGAFKGPETGATAREQLRESRNIPAVILSDAMGVSSLEDSLIKWGYKTIENGKGNYGPSLTLGGGEVTMIEHAQGYGVFSNGGQLVRLNPIQRITKINPETGQEDEVYNKEIKKEPVADQRAIYMVNHILNWKNNGPGANFDGRDHSGKTGTTELSKDTIYVGYTPDFVVVGWNGNNDNTSMSSRAFGENVTKPWVVNLTQRIAPFFPEKRPFARPGGLVSGNSCGGNQNGADSDLNCAETGGDLQIEGKLPPAYIYTKTFKVCTDQQDRLARDLDENLGFAMEKEIKIYKMPSPGLQPFLDAAVDSANLIPTEYCNKVRSPNGNNPWGVFTAPGNGSTTSGNVNFTVQGYSVQGNVTKIEVYIGNPNAGGVYVGEANSNTYSGSVDLSSYETAQVPIYARVFDNTGAIGDSAVIVNVNAATSSNLVVSSPGGTVTVGSPATISFSYSGGYSFSRVVASVRNATTGVTVTSMDITGGSGSWTPTAAGNYYIFLRGFTAEGIVVVSQNHNVTAN